MRKNKKKVRENTKNMMADEKIDEKLRIFEGRKAGEVFNENEIDESVGQLIRPEEDTFLESE